MCAKVMLNMKKTIQMSDFIPNGVGKILYVKAFYWEMYGKPGIKAVHQKLHLVKSVDAKDERFFFFRVCANVGVLFSIEILPQACKKHIQNWFSL